MKTLKRFFKRLRLKLYIKLLRLMDDKYQKSNTPHALEAFLICKLLIDKEDSILLTSPISGKRYIKQDEGRIFVVIEMNNITVVNHIYKYNIPVYGKNFARILTYFDKMVEHRRNQMESEIMANVKHSLHMIVESLKQESK